jgi:hypothetical protein
MSCLFNSLQYFIGEGSFEIRQKICDYLEQNGKIIDGIETNVILQLESNNYIQHMRTTSTWGGAIEIQAACNIWNISIIVRDRRNNNNDRSIEFLPVTCESSKKIELEWTGGHYEPVRN